MKLSRKKQFQEFVHDPTNLRTIELVVVSILILLITVVVGVPTISDIMQLRDDLKQANVLQAGLSQKRTNLEKAATLAQQTSENRSLFTDAFPTHPKQFDLLNTVRVVGEREDVVFDSIEHAFAGEEGEVNFTITGSGTYDAVTRFIETLEQVPRLIQLTQVAISKVNEANTQPGTSLSFTIMGLGYYYPEEVALLSDAS